jgi:hypothetical protein
MSFDVTNTIETIGQDGNRYIVYEMTETGADGQEVGRELMTALGVTVTRLGDGKYRLASGILLTPIRP